MKQPNKWGILTGVIMAMFLSSLDQTIVATAMPKVLEDLHGLEHLSWVFTAYMLGSTVTVPVYGKLSDIFGRRGLYILGIIIFLAGSALCGLSANMTQLIIFRGLQGIGGGAMMVNSFAIIGDVFPPAERGKYQGLIGGVFGLSSIAGPLLGGWITDNISWRWVFYVNLPVGIITILVLLAALPKIVQHKNQSIDFMGAFFITAFLVPLLLALVWGGSVYAWNSSTIIISLSVALISFIIFIITEKKAKNPILSLGLFKNKVFTTSVIATFFTAMGMFGAILYIPIFAQGVIGVSATNSGLILTPMMIALILASTISGQIISRTGKYKALAVAGMVITVAGMFLFSSISIHTSNITLMMRMVVLGLGLGSTMPIFTLAIQSAFPKERLGEVTAGSQLFRSVGGTVGTAILGGIMNSRLNSQIEEIRRQPFIATMQHYQPAATQHLNGSSIQNFLSPQVQAGLTGFIKKLPAMFQQSMLAQFNAFLQSIRSAFTYSIDHIFIVSGMLMIVPLITVLMLPEIPLRKSERPALEEAGIQLEDEMAMTDCHERPEGCEEDEAA